MRFRRLWAGAWVVLACAALAAPASAEDPAGLVLEQHGQASYYSDALDRKPTASGAAYDKTSLTAASPTLPIGTRAKVTNEATGRSVEVRVTDRGPHAPGRIIDVSRKAAKRLRMRRDGVVPVKVEARPSKQPTRALAHAIAAMAKRQKRGHAKSK